VDAVTEHWVPVRFRGGETRYNNFGGELRG
jgi:hypothetical protein